MTQLDIPKTKNPSKPRRQLSNLFIDQQFAHK